MKIASLLWGASLLASVVEARHRVVQRVSVLPKSSRVDKLRSGLQSLTGSPTPTASSPPPSGTATPSGGCRYPATVTAPAPSGSCAPGQKSFALQVADCRSPINGQFAHVKVSYVDSFGGKPVPPNRRYFADLWANLAPCTRPGCLPEPVLPADPTRFYIDENQEVYVDPTSTFAANGSWVIGKRLDYFAPQQNYPGTDMVPFVHFFVPGASNETTSGNKPVTCTAVPGTGAISCSVKLAKSTETLLWGSIGQQYDANNNTGEGVALALAPTSMWEQACSGIGGLEPCGPWTMEAVPACR